MHCYLLGNVILLLEMCSCPKLFTCERKEGNGSGITWTSKLHTQQMTSACDHIQYKTAWSITLLLKDQNNQEWKRHLNVRIKVLLGTSEAWLLYLRYHVSQPNECKPLALFHSFSVLCMNWCIVSGIMWLCVANMFIQFLSRD